MDKTYKIMFPFQCTVPLILSYIFAEYLFNNLLLPLIESIHWVHREEFTHKWSPLQQLRITLKIIYFHSENRICVE